MTGETLPSNPFDLTTDDGTVPIPPRYWWLKRIVAACGVFLAALVGIRLWWGHIADARFQAKINEYRAAGEPVYAADFDAGTAPDRDSAVQTLDKAVAAVSLTTADETLIESVLDDPASCERQEQGIRAMLQANAEVLNLVRAARSQPKPEWSIGGQTTLLTLAFPQSSQYRQMAKMLDVAAWDYHVAGNDAEAIGTLRDVLAMADVYSRDCCVLITHLVSMAIAGTSLDVVENLAPELHADSRSRATRTLLALRGSVESFIAELLDESGTRESWRYALYAERAWHADVVQNISEGGLSRSYLATLGGPAPATPSEMVSGFLFGPAWKLDGIRVLEHTTSVLRAGDQTSYPAASKNMPASPNCGSGITFLVRIFSCMMIPSYDRFLQLHYRLIAHRRMAATALAIRLYELDHGQRPDTLAALVPDYLPAVPSDPFAADGRPIGYRPHDAQPVLYSVGLDGIDDQGRYDVRSDGSVDAEKKDTVFFLNGDRPRANQAAPTQPPTSTQAADHDREVERDRGQDDHGQDPQRTE
jgi:hypothetical protein